MKDLRNVLIDARIELRKLQRDFHKTELCERMDLALQSLPDLVANANAAAAAGNGSAAPPAPAAPAAPPEKAQTTSQVALAWQTAARDLRFSHAALYQQLSDKVMRLLGAKSLVDPTNEILQLQARVTELEAAAGEQAKRYGMVEMERDALLGALSEAVPELAGTGDRLGVALAQVNYLREHGANLAPGKSGGGGSSPGPRRPDPESHIPTNEILAQVSSGVRKFTDDQRNWAVGEGMVLSGFQFTPVELVEMGDQALAALIIEKKPG